MPSERLVKCEVSKGAGAGAGSVRYVPSEIFGLWRHLMRSKHGFEVKEGQASLWVDVEEKPEAAYSETQYDRVLEVSLLFYSEKDGMFDRVRRYFPLEDYPRLRDVFLSHYMDEAMAGGVSPQVKEKRGIWIHRGERIPPI
jgi:hypothetical protein